MQNYYEILDIESSATEEQVRSAIAHRRRTARALSGHPNAEKRHESERLMQQLAEAEKLLLNSQTRVTYDADLQTFLKDADQEKHGADQSVPLQQHEELRQQTLQAQQQNAQMQREMERLQQEIRRKELEHEQELQRLQNQTSSDPTQTPTQVIKQPEPSQDTKKSKPKTVKKQKKPRQITTSVSPQDPNRAPYRILPVLEVRDANQQQLESAEEILRLAGAGHTQDAVRAANDAYRAGRCDAAIIQAYAWALIYDIYRCTYAGFAGPNPYGAQPSPLGTLVSSAQIWIVQLRLAELKRLPLQGFTEIDQATREIQDALIRARKRQKRLNWVGIVLTILLANYLFLPQLMELLGLSGIPSDRAASVWFKDLVQVVLFPYVFIALAFPAQWTEDRSFIKRAKKNSPSAPPVPWWYGVKRAEPLT